MGTLLALFAAGTIGFYVLLVLVGILITTLVEKEEGFWATVTLIGTIVTLNWAYKLPIWKTIQLHPFWTSAWVLGYLVAGAVWSLIKWTVSVKKQDMKYKNFKADFLREEKATELTPALAAKLADKLDGRYGKDITAEPPVARDHRSSLIRWATYWPFSMIGTALNDFVRKIFNYIYEMLQTTYQRISDHLFREATADMELARQFKEDQKKQNKAVEADLADEHGYRRNR
jgi:phosphate/sulfate permease